MDPDGPTAAPAHRRPILAADVSGSVTAGGASTNGHAVPIEPPARLPRLRIAQVAPPLETVPPRAYGGTERVVAELVAELARRGHEVTTFASGDSPIPAGRHVPTVPRALWADDGGGDAAPWFLQSIEVVAAEAVGFDVVHSHLEWWSPLLARAIDVPVVATFHGRLDMPWAAALFGGGSGIVPVAISRHQASAHPDVDFRVVHNGLTLDAAPFERRHGDGLCFVGRIDPEKGLLDAIEIARLSGRTLRIAAKIGTLPWQQDLWKQTVQPAIRRAGSAVEFLGELAPADRDRLVADSAVTVMPGAWPEPFGLVAIESLACGTPVVARRIGALPEIIRDGVDGCFGDDVQQLAFVVDRAAGLDRAAIRASVLDRFSARRMVDGYEAAYAAALGLDATAAPDSPADATGPTLRRVAPVPARVASLDAARAADGRSRSGVHHGSLARAVLPEITASTVARSARRSAGG